MYLGWGQVRDPGQRLSENIAATVAVPEIRPPGGWLAGSTRPRSQTDLGPALPSTRGFQPSLHQWECGVAGCAVSPPPAHCLSGPETLLPPAGPGRQGRWQGWGWLGKGACGPGVPASAEGQCWLAR